MLTFNGQTYRLSGTFDSTADAIAHPPTRAPRFNVGDLVVCPLDTHARTVLSVTWRTHVAGFSGGRQWMISMAGYMGPESTVRPADDRKGA